MTPDVEKVVLLIKKSFSNDKVIIYAEPQGGAYVEVLDILLSKIYMQGRTWIGFLITFQYPESDVYPHFVRHDLTRKDNEKLGGGFSISTWLDKPAIQISRKSNKLKPEADQALTKLIKVIEWLNKQ